MRLLGANPETIDKAEDRQIFKDTMLSIGEPVIPSLVVYDVPAALTFAQEISYPTILRQSSTEVRQWGYHFNLFPLYMSHFLGALLHWTNPTPRTGPRCSSKTWAVGYGSLVPSMGKHMRTYLHNMVCVVISEKISAPSVFTT